MYASMNSLTGRVWSMVRYGNSHLHDLWVSRPVIIVVISQLIWSHWLKFMNLSIRDWIYICGVTSNSSSSRFSSCLLIHSLWDRVGFAKLFWNFPLTKKKTTYETEVTDFIITFGVFSSEINCNKRITILYSQIARNLSLSVSIPRWK